MRLLPALLAMALAATAAFASTHSCAPTTSTTTWMFRFLAPPIGSRSLFHDKSTDEHFAYVNEGMHDHHGRQVLRIRRTRDGGRDDLDLLRYDGVRVALVHRTVYGQDLPLEPGVTLLEHGLEPGAEYTTTPGLLNPATGARMEWTVNVRPDLISITTPAGTFEHCIWLTLTVRDLRLGTVLAKVDQYHAENVGMVARRGQFFGRFISEELEGR